MERLRHLRSASIPIVLAFLAAIAMSTTTGGAGPSSQPLLQPGDLSYAGAFLLPDGAFGKSDFHFAGYGAAYNPANNSLFMTGDVTTGQWTTEIAVPALSKSSTVTDLPIATVLRQPFTDASEGTLQTLGVDVKIGGYLISNGRLIFDGYVYYDGNGTQRLSHFSRPLNLSTTGQVQGPFAMVVSQTRGTFTAGTNITGGVSGPMAAIPPEWQPLLGGPAMAEQCCIPVPSRTSFGPGFFVFDPATLGAATPANMLLYYDQAHPLGAYDQQGPYYNGSTEVHGVVFPSGTRSVLYFGRQGTGPFCYGEGVPMNPPVPPIAPDGMTNCYDPTDSSKGTHSFPYISQIWAYDANDLLAVKQGQKQPWDPRPYATWALSPQPFFNATGEIQFATYDPATNRLFVMQAYAYGQWGDLPVVYVYNVRTGSNSPAPPTNLRIIK